MGTPLIESERQLLAKLVQRLLEITEPETVVHKVYPEMVPPAEYRHIREHWIRKPGGIVCMFLWTHDYWYFWGNNTVSTGELDGCTCRIAYEEGYNYICPVEWPK